MKTALGWWLSGFVCGALLTTAYAVHLIENPLKPKVVYATRPEFGTLPPDCDDFYDDDKHEKWADCMGVGYTQKRDDI